MDQSGNDLGLIYQVEMMEDRVYIATTLTTPGCPLGTGPNIVPTVVVKGRVLVRVSETAGRVVVLDAVRVF